MIIIITTTNDITDTFRRQLIVLSITIHTIMAFFAKYLQLTLRNTVSSYVQ